MPRRLATSIEKAMLINTSYRVEYLPPANEKKLLLKLRSVNEITMEDARITITGRGGRSDIDAIIKKSAHRWMTCGLIEKQYPFRSFKITKEGLKYLDRIWGNEKYGITKIPAYKRLKERL